MLRCKVCLGSHQGNGDCDGRLAARHELDQVALENNGEKTLAVRCRLLTLGVGADPFLDSGAELTRSDKD